MLIGGSDAEQHACVRLSIRNACCGDGGADWVRQRASRDRNRRAYFPGDALRISNSTDRRPGAVYWIETPDAANI